MKAKIIGIVIMLAVVFIGGSYYIFQKQTQTTVINGYLGGEKTGLFEDEDVKEILRKQYHIEFKYSRSGSLDMVTEDKSGRDYLFPSSQTALEYYNDVNGKPAADEIIFNTPIVLYSHKMVADALVSPGVVTQTDGVYFCDMKKLTDLILADTQWSDIGLPELYGAVMVDTTDPVRSNSGNMYAALLANVLNDGKNPDEQAAEQIIPQLKEIFSKIGYMETSSSDLFNQFLRTGVGAKPMIAGYENQLLEYAAENPEKYEQIKDDVVIIYPTPTVWSAHIYIALNENGKQGIKALSDEKIQELAWEKHGFRTGDYGALSEGGEGGVSGVSKQVNSVINVPEYRVMKKIIDSLK